LLVCTPSITYKGVVSLFKGKDTSLGAVEATQTAVAWIIDAEDDAEAWARIHTCTVFFIRPRDFLTKGMTKRGAGNGEAIDAKAVEYLPKYTKAQMSAVGFQRAKDVPVDYANVNFSCAKRVGIIALSLASTWSQAVGWKRAFGARPCDVTEAQITTKVSQKFKPPAANLTSEQLLKDPYTMSIKILWEDVSEMQANEDLWKTGDVVSAVNNAIAAAADLMVERSRGTTTTSKV